MSMEKDAIVSALARGAAGLARSAWKPVARWGTTALQAAGGRPLAQKAMASGARNAGRGALRMGKDMLPWMAMSYMMPGGEAAPASAPAAGGAGDMYPAGPYVRPQLMNSWKYASYAEIPAEQKAAFEYGIDEFCKQARFDDEDRAAMYDLVKRAWEWSDLNPMTWTGKDWSKNLAGAASTFVPGGAAAALGTEMLTAPLANWWGERQVGKELSDTERRHQEAIQMNRAEAKAKGTTSHYDQAQAAQARGLKLDAANAFFDAQKDIKDPRRLARMALRQQGIDYTSNVGKEFLQSKGITPQQAPGMNTSATNLSTATGGFQLPKEPNPANQPPPPAPPTPKTPAMPKVPGGAVMVP